MMTKKYLADDTIPQTEQRLRVLSLLGVYGLNYIGGSLKRIYNAKDAEELWFLIAKTFFSLDPSLNCIERFNRKIKFKANLKDYWGLKTADELREQIMHLVNGRNSIYASIEIEIYKALEGKEIKRENILETDTFKEYYEEEDVESLIGALILIDNNKHLLTEVGVLGFDIARAINLLRMGYCSKIISIKEAWLLIDMLSHFPDKFESYYSYFASFELGFLLFDYNKGYDIEQHYIGRAECCFKLLVDSVAPYKTLNDILEKKKIWKRYLKKYIEILVIWKKVLMRN